jgi:hypothetical protein
MPGSPTGSTSTAEITMHANGSGRVLIWSCHGVCLEGLRKVIENVSLDSQSQHRNLKLTPPHYETTLAVTFFSNNNNNYYYNFIIIINYAAIVNLTR